MHEKGKNMIDLLEMAKHDDPGVQPTQAVEKIVLDGRSENMPVYRIQLDKLYYNAQNDRIATWISGYRAEHGEHALESASREEFNSIVEEFIVNSNPEAIRKTQGNIELRTQERPGVVLANGLVIDGNRRFTCLRRLSRKNPQFGYFEAVILPTSYGDDPRAIKILELSLQHATEEKVGYDPIDRLVGIYNDLLNPVTSLLTKAEYAKYADMPEKEVDKQIEMAQYMVDFLEFIGAEGQFHIARELSLGSLFNEMPAILKKCANEEQEEQVKNILFTNILMQPQGDRVRFVRPIKLVLESDRAEDFIDRESDLTAEVVERLAANEGSVEDGIRELQADDGLAEQLKQTMDSAASEAKRQKAIGSPAEALKKALKDLDQVEEDVFDVLDDESLRDVRSVLKRLSERLGQIDAAVRRTGE